MKNLVFAVIFCCFSGVLFGGSPQGKMSVDEGVKAFQEKNYAKAKEIWTKVISDKQSDVISIQAATINLAKLYLLHENNYKKAIEMASKETIYMPQDVEAHRILVGAYLKLGDKMNALKFLERLERICPNQENMFGLACLYLQNGQIENYLVELCILGDIGLVEKALKEYPGKINSLDKNGMSPLAGAFAAENLELVKLLIQSGADIKGRSNDGLTLMHSAAKGNFPEGIKFLFRQGLSIKDTDKNGNMPIHHAAFFNQAKSAKALLECGSSPYDKGQDGHEAIEMAFTKKAKDVIDIFYSWAEATGQKLRVPQN